MLIETDDEARELLNGSVSDAFPSLSLVLFVSLVSSREYPEPFSVVQNIIQCPFNIRKAFTRSGGSGTGKNSQGGIYRFYPNFERDPRPKFLMAKKNYDVQLVILKYAKILEYFIQTA